MSTGGGAGFDPEEVYNQRKSDKSLMEKIKGALKPSKLTETGPASGRHRPMNKSVHNSDNMTSSSGPSSYYTTTGEGEAYPSRTEEGIQQTACDDIMPSGTDMRHQDQDTTGDITETLKSASSTSRHSTTGHVAHEITDNAGNVASSISKKLDSSLGSDPGSAFARR